MSNNIICRIPASDLPTVQILRKSVRASCPETPHHDENNAVIRERRITKAGREINHNGSFFIWQIKQQGTITYINYIAL
jgi:hypothetical protein